VKRISFNDFIKVYFLHCFFQRHVSALVMSYHQVDHFFLSKVNHITSNAIVIVTYEISYNLYKIKVNLVPLCNSIEII